MVAAALAQGYKFPPYSQCSKDTMDTMESTIQQDAIEPLFDPIYVAYAAIICMACLPIYIGSLRSVKPSQEVCTAMSFSFYLNACMVSINQLGE